MKRTNQRHLPGFAGAFAWLALGLSVSACVAKPAFHCQSDDACVSADGTHGTCEANGECSFQSSLGDAGGAGGSSAATAGTTSSGGDAPSGGGNASSGSGGSTVNVDAGGGDAGAPDVTGAAGASCTDETANNCYSCRPSTSVQFLNACTASTCVPFDDSKRLTNLTTTGDLPPLPAVSP